MRYAEVRRNILNTPSDYTIAITANAELEIGHGLLSQFWWKDQLEIERLQVMRHNELAEGKKAKDYIGKVMSNPYGGKQALCLLITRHRLEDVTTYEMLALALHNLRDRCIYLEIPKLAMPTIGCGSGRLKWTAVSRIIQGIFSDTQVDIMICHEPLKGKPS